MFLLFCNWIISSSSSHRHAMCNRLFFLIHLILLLSHWILPHKFSIFAATNNNNESGVEFLLLQARERVSSTSNMWDGMWIAPSHSVIFANDLRIFTFQRASCRACVDTVEFSREHKIYEQSHSKMLNVCRFIGWDGKAWGGCLMRG